MEKIDFAEILKVYGTKWRLTNAVENIKIEDVVGKYQDRQRRLGNMFGNFVVCLFENVYLDNTFGKC